MNKLTTRHKAIAIATLILTLALLISPRFVVPVVHRHGFLLFDRQETGCLPWEWYWGSFQVGTIHRGDIVTFRNEQASLFPRGALITKIVAGMPGDSVVIDQGVVRVNGQVLGTLLRGAQHFRKPINSWDAHYTIPPGQYYLFGSEFRSYDSRYWGPIRYDQIYTKDQLLY